MSAFHAAIGRYVEKHLYEKRISVLKSQFYKGQQGREIKLEHSHTGEKSVQAFDLTLLLLGKKQTLLLHVNSSGQVILACKVLHRSYALTTG